jgi:c-di-GMP-binding flagellar brake protein YcgR
LIPALCEVISSTEEEHEGARGCRVACRFVAIADADRDTLVNYIFIRERETIRSTKGKKE